MADDRPVLDPDELSPDDLDRAKAVVPDGLSPWQMLEEPEWAVKLTVWALLSRDNPELTWAEAMRTPFSRFRRAARPPRTPTSGEPSASPKPSGSPTSKRKATASTSAPSSAPTST